jgi:hypothetical protein
MPINLIQIQSTLSNKALTDKVKSALLNNIQQSVGIPTDNISTLNKNIIHLYDGGFEAKTLITRVLSALAQNNAIDGSMDDSTIDGAVASVWNNLFSISL